eukprot:CAMPEP_0175224140 /NCGR_PEP_ID=MMETSP0093-20121207/21693_1 /TAXON_ID=311494 /ORGANISM="Alexandrium monilatum, Strain CCMP3105" /LENGTH=41 /DNA_ID= /DNA_START= /DNA_END= /DNA_ORIENTATION=
MGGGSIGHPCRPLPESPHAREAPHSNTALRAIASGTEGAWR